MYTDPMVVTISGAAKSMNRTGSTANGGSFSTADRAVRVDVAHTYGTRTRHLFKITVDTLVPNPLISGQNVQQSMSAHLVVNVPNGYDTTTSKGVVDGLLAYLTASSGVAVTKLIGGES